VRTKSFAPLGLVHFPFYPRLTPWAAFLRRFAATDSPFCSIASLEILVFHAHTGRAALSEGFSLRGLNRIRAFAAWLKPCPSTEQNVWRTTRNQHVQQPPEIEAHIEAARGGCPPLRVAVRGTRTGVSAPHAESRVWFIASHPSAQNAEEWGTPPLCVI